MYRGSELPRGCKYVERCGNTVPNIHSYPNPERLLALDKLELESMECLSVIAKKAIGRHLINFTPEQLLLLQGAITGLSHSRYICLAVERFPMSAGPGELVRGGLIDIRYDIPDLRDPDHRIRSSHIKFVGLVLHGGFLNKYLGANERSLSDASRIEIARQLRITEFERRERDGMVELFNRKEIQEAVSWVFGR